VTFVGSKVTRRRNQWTTKTVNHLKREPTAASPTSIHNLLNVSFLSQNLFAKHLLKNTNPFLQDNQTQKMNKHQSQMHGSVPALW
jgi:hypothetical protein